MYLYRVVIWTKNQSDNTIDSTQDTCIELILESNGPVTSDRF